MVSPRSQGGALARPPLVGARRHHPPRAAVRGRPHRGAGDATRLAAQALRAGAEVVVAVGGDGTINEVANGFRADGQPVAPGAALAILPFGTGGDFRRTARIPKRLGGGGRGPVRGARLTIDVDRRRLRSDATAATAARGAQRGSVNIASFGLSGVTDRFVNQGQKRLGGKLSFFAATTRALLADDDQRVHLVFDEQPADAVDMTIVHRRPSPTVATSAAAPRSSPPRPSWTTACSTWSRSATSGSPTSSSRAAASYAGIPPRPRQGQHAAAAG
ncbi:MAG: NAD(+)/NADH kinase [Kofleriaceae bacterium]|nr:NAD(+)/NADH kinase [Kofleriaceae bacterium]